jgi:Protein of unknown function (DUF2795)
MSLGTKKKDKGNKDGDSGGETSANYIIAEAGGAKGRSDTRKEEEVEAARVTEAANKVPSSSSQEYTATTTQKEKLTSTSPPSHDEMPSEAMKTTTTSEIPQYQQQREQHDAINRVLDETRDNIRRSIDEARNQIPHYTQAVNEYQEQTIQASTEIAENHIESQKEIINSLQSAWLPQIETANSMLTSNWISPRRLTEIYANMVSSAVDNMIAATRLVNNMMFASMNAFKTSMLQAKDNAKELSRVSINAVRFAEQISRDTADPSSSRFYGVREHFEVGEQQGQEQIPSRAKEEETQRVIEAQDHISGERREQTIRDFPGAAAVGQALKGLRFPSDKNKIVQFVQQQSNTNPDCQKIVPLLQRIEDRQYQNVSDVAKTAGLVE